MEELSMADKGNLSSAFEAAVAEGKDGGKISDKTKQNLLAAVSAAQLQAHWQTNWEMVKSGCMNQPGGHLGDGVIDCSDPIDGVTIFDESGHNGFAYITLARKLAGSSPEIVNINFEGVNNEQLASHGEILRKIIPANFAKLENPTNIVVDAAGTVKH
jgi:hypothetical protein